MPTIEVFEALQPVKGRPVDDGVAFSRTEFEAGLRSLQSRGVEIRRPAIPPDRYVTIENATVKTALELQGPDALPMVAVEGTVISVGGYPTRAELGAAAGIPATQDPEFFREALAIVAGMSAALAVNNLDQCRLLYQKARALGLSVEDLRNALEGAKAVGRESIRDESLTELDRFLALGPSGKPKVSHCTCGT